jgi:hypothetical protein
MSEISADRAGERLRKAAVRGLATPRPRRYMLVRRPLWGPDRGEMTEGV